MIGDFDAHNVTWRYNSTDGRVKMIEKIIINDNMVILNDTSFTHINIANGNFSCIDLSLITPAITQRLQQQPSTNLHKLDTKTN